MKKLILYMRVYWLRMLFIILGIALSVAGFFFLRYCTVNFLQLESFSKKTIAGQMALMIPMFLLVHLLSLPLMYGLQTWMMQGGGLGSLKKKRIDDNKMDVKWTDVIGMEEAKKDAWEVVQLLKNQNLLKDVGGKIIKGTLMIGPPGCGKTYLAKAIATECDMPMLSAVGSEFVCMYVGQGASKMRSLFKQARQIAKVHDGCIIFIDEIDAFARPRGSGLDSRSSNSENATINQFLTELDGLNPKENNIVVIAATNVNEEELDPAIMRSGRFDRKIRIEKPTAKEREEIIKFYLSKITADKSIDIAALADKTKWFSPSDISNMIRESGIIALRDKRSNVLQKDLDIAVERLMHSIEKMGGDKILTSKVNVKWDDVIGMKEAKQEAWEIVELLRDRHLLRKVGGKIVKGILFLGPPGCGKTYLAKAMATESGFPFISKSGTDFIEQFVGVGPKRVRSMFEEARKLARAEGGCIIFIDEIDSIGRHRMNDAGYGGPTEYNNTINQLLTEMDGLRQAENNIVVMAATNASEDELDSAMVRAGRFERKIYVTKPNLEEREELFKFYLSKVETEHDINPQILARRTVWFSAADVDNMIREAGIISLREKREKISYKDLSMAYDRVMYGNKSNTVLSNTEKEWTAYHESGHAIINYMLHPTDDVIKATIIPHKGSLGFVAPRSKEEVHIHNREWIMAKIKMTVASYAAEMIRFGTTGSGVGGGSGSDFHTAMSLAKTMVWNYGMGKSGLIGDFSALEGHHGQSFLSEKMKEQLNQDVQDILQLCLKEVSQILNDKRELLDYFAQQLVQKGELEYDEIEAIFNKFGVQSMVSRKI